VKRGGQLQYGKSALLIDTAYKDLAFVPRLPRNSSLNDMMVIRTLQ
jgi:hypothetical protein